jgi:hypothetical protein
MASASKTYGKIAELLFSAEALKRGMIVSAPIEENHPYDYIVDNGRTLFKVQIKSAFSSCKPGRSSGRKHPSYEISLSRRVYKNKELSDWVGADEKCISGDYDVLAFYIAPEGAWYIIPFSAPEIYNKHRLWLFDDNEGGHSRLTSDVERKYRENWGLFRLT